MHADGAGCSAARRGVRRRLRGSAHPATQRSIFKWAINDFGIRCVISTSFADIFFNNCFKNGMLPVQLPEEAVRKLMAEAQKEDNAFEVDLEAQVVRAGGEEYAFDVDAFRKHCLLNGLDDIGLTLQKGSKIDAFERVRSETMPWLDGIGGWVPN